MIDCFKCKKIGLFLGGVLFGTAGVKVLASTEDILAEAKDINEKRRQEDVFEDESVAEDADELMETQAPADEVTE